MPEDTDPIEAANEIIRSAMDGTHSYELEQFAMQNAHLVGNFWQALGKYMPHPELADARLELTRLYAIRIIFGNDSRVEIDA